MSRVIELRSDTYTKPTPQMYEAMTTAELGNDGVDEDPTVNDLQDIAAEMLGKEAALFMPSGTMANLCAIMSHCRRGHSIILDNKSHIYVDETGNVGALAGCLAHPLECPGGVYDSDQLSMAIEEGSLTHPPTGLVCLENTHNRRGGIAVPVSRMKEIADIAHARGVPVHLDGARIFNAAIALGCEARQIAEHTDSLMFCLSKGLACPVGSILLGTRDFIASAKVARRMLGGGMRQTGLLAAAGIVALENMVVRLAEDHIRAKHLAKAISQIVGLEINLAAVETNMVYITVKDKDRVESIISALAKEGVNVSASGPGLIRLVTHYCISDEDVEQTLLAFGDVINESGVSPGTHFPS